MEYRTKIALAFITLATAYQLALKIKKDIIHRKIHQFLEELDNHLEITDIKLDKEFYFGRPNTIP